MKKIYKIFGYVITILLVFLLVVAIYQKDYIAVYLGSLKYTEEEATKIVDKLNEEIKKSNQNDQSEIGQSQVEKSEPKKEEQTFESDLITEDNSLVVNKYLSNLYSIKGNYMGQLDSVVSTAMAEYRALPKKERGAAAKQAMVSKYMGKVQSLQNSCDAEVEAVLSSLNKELKAQKMDTKIVDILRASYKEEKSAKLAYYMSIYKK